MITTISSKGQITLPVKLRKRLGLKPGMKLEFDETGDYLIARPAFDAAEMEEVFGCSRNSSAGQNTAQMLKDQRGYDRSEL